MSDTIIKIYNKLLNQSRFYDISFMNEVSYIKTLTNSNNISEKCIFIYKHVHAANSSFTELNPIIKIENKIIDLDLTGTPLEDDCNIDVMDISFDTNKNDSNQWSRDEETYSLIPLNKARYF